MSRISNKLIRRKTHRKELKAKRKLRPQVMYKGKLKKKGWPGN